MPAIVPSAQSFRGPGLAALAAAAVVSLGPRLCAAQPGAPLFSSDDQLELTLTLPVRTLLARRAKRPDLDGTLSYTGAGGGTVSLDLSVTTRGHSRLEECDFPPLKLNLKRKQADDTLFAGQNKLKLTTRCKKSESYEQYLELEYLIYRIYEKLAPAAFRVRAVSVQYVDTDRKNRIETVPGFLIEDVHGIADRAGMRLVEQERIDPDKLDAEQTAVFSVFQYVIGNTDWSVLAPDPGDPCCHNAEILGPQDGSAGLIPVPYDFDQAGLIDIPYALPDERLPIRSVRERLYRGRCMGNEYLEQIVRHFDATRADIDALLQSGRLNDKYREKAAKYVAGSYEILDDPEQRQEEIVMRCRGAN